MSLQRRKDVRRARIVDSDDEDASGSEKEVDSSDKEDIAKDLFGGDDDSEEEEEDAPVGNHALTM